MNVAFLTRRTSACLVALLGPLLICAVLSGQEKPEFATLNPARLADLLEKVDASTLTDEQKEKVKDYVRQAKASLEKDQKHKASQADFEKQLESLNEELTAAKAELKKKPTERTVDQTDDLTTLQQQLADASTQLKDAKSELERLDREPARRTMRRMEIPRVTEEGKTRLTEIREQLMLDPPADEPPLITQARRASLQAEENMFRRQAEAFKQELTFYDQSSDLLRAERDLSARSTANLDQFVQELTEVVGELRRQQAEAESEQARLEAVFAGPELRAWAETNQQLAEEISGVTSQVETAAKKLRSVNKQVEEIKDDTATSKQQVTQIGLSESIGLRLRKDRALLPSINAIREEIKLRQDEARDVQARLIDDDRRRSQLALLEREVDRGMVQVRKQASKMSEADLKSGLRQLLQRERQLLDSLITELETEFDLLVQINTEQTRLCKSAQDYRDYINSLILWVPSTQALSVRDFAMVRVVGSRLNYDGHWRTTLLQLVADAGAHRPLYLACFVAYVASLLLRSRISQRLKRLGARAEDPCSVSYWSTGEALLLSVILALQFPLPLFFVYWRLLELGPDSEQELMTAEGFSRLAELTFALTFARELTTDRGLAVSHFGWSVERCKLIHGSVTRFSVLLLVLILPAIPLVYHTDAEIQNSLGRLAGIVVLSVIVLFSNRLAFRIRRLPRSENRRASYAFPSLWYLATVVLPVGGIALLATGYVYTGFTLVHQLRQTVTLLFLILILGALLQRFFVILRRRRVNAREQMEANGEVVSGRISEIDELDQQSRNLLKAVVIVVSLAGLWHIWSEALPALNVLNEVTLWTVDTPNGVRETTLFHLCASAVILCLTLAAVRDLPAILELLLLKRLPFDFGARYALMTVVRYGVLTGGFVFGFHVLGIRWAQYQWLVAAATFGLGFGLQEIFANFVSGLILLAERPIRVGDVVTVGNITGRISKISMRATVLTNWERQEYIIPNRDFITGRVLNWTLTDAVNRILVTVNVAGDTDPDAARDLLLEVARNHPLTTDDPGPIATFDKFEDGTLQMSLRCYLPDMDNRLSTIHALHTSIHHAFRDAGITIAVPRRDIRITSEVGQEADAAAMLSEADAAHP